MFRLGWQQMTSSNEFKCRYLTRPKPSPSSSLKSAPISALEPGIHSTRHFVTLLNLLSSLAPSMRISAASKPHRYGRVCVHENGMSLLWWLRFTQTADVQPSKQPAASAALFLKGRSFEVCMFWAASTCLCAIPSCRKRDFHCRVYYLMRKTWWAPYVCVQAERHPYS